MQSFPFRLALIGLLILLQSAGFGRDASPIGLPIQLRSYITPTQPGFHSFPSGDTQTGEGDALQGASLEFSKTVGLDPSACGISKIVSVDKGTAVTYCFKATNTGTESLDLHTVTDYSMGPLLEDYAYALLPSTSYFFTVTTTIDTPVISISTWTAQSESAAIVSSSDITQVNLGDAAIKLEKTVGLDAGTCATGERVVVLSGTQVTYCYTVTNTGSLPLSLHSLNDAQLGSLLDNLAFDLLPNTSEYITQTVVVTNSITGQANWIAKTPGGLIARDTDEAQVVVLETLHLPLVLKP